MGDDRFHEREPFLRRVLEELEAGRLEPYEYTRRVLAINAAGSAADMAAIARAPAPAGAAPALDAVDLALLGRARVQPRSGAVRYAALVVVFVMFAVLLGLGVWLSSRVHAAPGQSGTLRPAVVVAAPGAALSAPA